MVAVRQNKHSREYFSSVFINCPFDAAYIGLFRAIAFAVIHCGFRARCAQEIDDGGEVRIEKIQRIIESCRYGIHDLSRTELDKISRLPRFNMPLELGLFLGAKRFGSSQQRRKVCLILDRKQYRYQQFISDISGQDIRTHRALEGQAIRVTRDWLSTSSGKTIPGGTHIYRQYARFKKELPSLCRTLKLNRAEMTFNDHANIVTAWVAASG
ncbi:MAG TPA: hypothetical protein VG270_10875 [Pseudolabrys sp.]|jgi:hypothetical protein|nr:hypothetical protein [Pseudolabrys sp.]